MGSIGQTVAILNSLTWENYTKKGDIQVQDLQKVKELAKKKCEGKSNPCQEGHSLDKAQS